MIAKMTRCAMLNALW